MHKCLLIIITVSIPQDPYGTDPIRVCDRSDLRFAVLTKNFCARDDKKYLTFVMLLLYYIEDGLCG